MRYITDTIPLLEEGTYRYSYLPAGVASQWLVESQWTPLATPAAAVRAAELLSHEIGVSDSPMPALRLGDEVLVLLQEGPAPFGLLTRIPCKL